jgi:hypothetical protein
MGFADALGRIGIAKATKKGDIATFSVCDQEILKEEAKRCLEDDEFVWLAADYFEELIIGKGNENIIFAIASKKAPEIKGPWERSAWYVSSLVGEMIYPPSIARILISHALRLAGHKDLATSINCTTNFPRETALSGDVLFVDPPLTFEFLMQDEDTGIRWSTFSVLSDQLLLTHRITDLLTKRELIDSIEIAKALPFQIFKVSDLSSFSVFNHLSVRAVRGQAAELLPTLLDAGVHLNWQEARDYVSTLPKDVAMGYAFDQRKRLARLEKKEAEITYALELLQRRYPDNSQLYQWQVNNIFANITRYSPIYLNWKSHLESFLEGHSNAATKHIDYLAAINWSVLDNKNIAKRDDAEKIIALLEIDPGSTLSRIRVIIEKMVDFVYGNRFGKHTRAKLADMISELNRHNVFPPIIYVYLNTLRLVGNIGAHEGGDSKEEVEAVLPIFVRTVEWFVDYVSSAQTKKP